MSRTAGKQALDLTTVQFAYRPDRMVAEERQARELVIEQGWRSYVAVSHAVRDLYERGNFEDEGDFCQFLTETWGQALWRELIARRWTESCLEDGEGEVEVEVGQEKQEEENE